MKYGLPYKGSKNKLAERIVRLLPRRANLVDLFCGGCAVSHAALLMGKFEHIYINDINWMCPTLFMDALQGKYANDTRWISREDFFRLRDTDPYVAMVWSFGNNMRDYLYSKEIEPLKKAIHYALFFSDYSLAKALGHDLSFIDPITDVQQRYRAVRQYFSQFGHFQQQSFGGGGGGEYPRDWKRWSDSKHAPSFKKKIQKRPREAEHRERTNSLTHIAIPRAVTQPAQKYMWEKSYPSRHLCLATSKWLYRQIA
jgi:hypothetical protein